MTIQTIDVGGYANDGTGDDLRTAFEKVNANFATLGTDGPVQDGENLGAGVAIFAQRNATDPNLEFKTLTSTDSSVEITSTTTTVNLKNKSTLVNDADPTLGADLKLNGRKITLGQVGGGDIETPVFGIDIRNLNSLISLMITSNSVSLDFGSILINIPGIPDPASVTVDMNGINPSFGGFSVADPSGSILDFGTIV
jgi:hypothetical protein